MRALMERWVALPFSIGCASQKSLSLATSQPKKSISESYDAVPRREEGEGSIHGLRMKNSRGVLDPPKPNIFHGIHRLIKSFKSFSQLFVYKEKMEEMDMEMEIGFPTDVKHVTHIGLDGSTTTNHVKGWENLKAPEILSFPAISLKQFELVMAAQVNPPLLGVSSS